MAAQSATVKVKVADPFPISACQNSAPYCIALSRPCPYRLLARSAMCTSAGEAPGKPRCFILVGGRHAAPRLAVNAFSRSLFGQLPCCNGRVETGAPEIASKASLKPHCEAGARTPCPGNTPSTRFPFLTTGTPPTSTNGIPSEYCSGFSYVALSMTVPRSKTVTSAPPPTPTPPLPSNEGP